MNSNRYLLIFIKNTRNSIFWAVCEIFLKLKFSKFVQDIRTLEISSHSLYRIQIGIPPLQKASKFHLNLDTFRKKSKQLCIPNIDTPQPKAC